MSDTVRCPSCFGAKKMMKLGGIMGDCNTCSGKGNVLQKDIPKPVPVPVVDSVVDIVKAVSNAVPVAIEQVKEVDVKVDPKKVIYKRKKA